VHAKHGASSLRWKSIGEAGALGQPLSRSWSHCTRVPSRINRGLGGSPTERNWAPVGEGYDSVDGARRRCVAVRPNHDTLRTNIYPEGWHKISAAMPPDFAFFRLFANGAGRIGKVQGGTRNIKYLMKLLRSIPRGSVLDPSPITFSAGNPAYSLFPPGEKNPTFFHRKTWVSCRVRLGVFRKTKRTPSPRKGNRETMGRLRD